MYYSNLRASIGFIRAAFHAGRSQNITPIRIENHVAKNTILRSIENAKSGKNRTTVFQII